jgi:hypothetical protein
MKIKNVGATFPRLKPVIRIRYFSEGHWRVITTHEFNEIGIIPQKELNLKSYIGKSLPSGKYQLDGVLYVDGEIRGTGGRLAKELEFEGDPLLTKAASDVPIDLDPGELTITASPGSKRYGYLKVHNATTEDIRIEAILDIPKPFKGIAANNVVVADAMTCLKWLSFDPKTLSLSEYETRTLGISVEMPEDATRYPYYYAALGLKGTYPDGQDAGTTWVNLCIDNKNTTAQPEDIECYSVNLTEFDAEKSEYLVQASFKNDGTTHIIPTTIKAAVVQADGFGRTAAMLKSNIYGMFLPYESRYYSGILDFSSVAEDDYNLEALMEFPTDQQVQQVRKQIRIRVTKNGDKKVPEIIERDVKSTDLIQVKW